MGSVTPTIVPGEGYVRVEVNWQDVAHNRRVWIFRTVGGVDTKLRDGDYVWLSNGIAVAFDHEAPLDTPVSYKSTIPLNWNGDFETGVTEWQDATSSGTVGTVSRSTDFYVPGTGNASAKLTPPIPAVATAKAVSEFIPITPSSRTLNPFFEVDASDWAGVNGATVARDLSFPHEGVASLLITPNGVGSVPQAQSGEFSAVAGNSYTYSGWLRVSSGGTASRDFGIAWFNAAHTFISTTATTLTPAPTVYTQYTATVVAPATTAFGRLITNGPGVLLAANTWRLDEAIVWDSTTATSYTLAGRLLLPAYWVGGIGLQLQWYNGTTLLSTSGALGDTTPFPGTWGSYSLTATDVATANAVRVVYGITGTPPSTLPLYGDEIYLTRAGTTATSSSTYLVPSNGGGWWTDPLHPATKLRLQVDLYYASCAPAAGVAYLGVADEEFAADSAAFEINDAVYPVATFQRRKSGRSSIRVGTATMADLASVKALHASGAPLLLQMSAALGEFDAYQLCDTLTTGRVHGDQAVQMRLIVASFAKVLAPVGPAEGTLRTRYVDLTKYATFAAATSAGVTWLDALRGNMAA